MHKYLIESKYNNSALFIFITRHENETTHDQNYLNSEFKVLQSSPIL